MPTLNFRGKLDYQKCAALYAKARDKEKGKSLCSKPHYYIRYDYHTHPHTKQYERAYSLLMYRTDILIFWADGTVYVDGYSSNTTTMVLNDYGPLRIFSNSGHRAQDTRRFWGERGANYPVGNGVVIDADGYVRGLKDTFRRVKKSAKKKRRELIAAFRLAATGRIILGEFAAAQKDAQGWQAMMPVGHDRDEAFQALLTEADHAKIAPYFAAAKPTRLAFGRKGKRYATQELAAMAVVNGLLRHRLQDGYDSPDHEDYTKRYGLVRAA